jgi:tagatose 6-phosphate kinase
MILCVTLNPCLDKTLIAPAWKPGDSVRGLAVREVVGGKGNNVARALKHLGRKAHPVTFLGGSIGTHCDHLLRHDDGLEPRTVTTEAVTRVILTVRTESTADQTAFFDPDPAVTTAEAEALYQLVETSLTEGGVTALTLSGSSPAAATHGLYLDLIALSRARKVPVFLDTYGPALDAVWGFWPDAIQLNHREASAHLRTSNANEDDLFVLLGQWAGRGVHCAVVTNGPGPVLIQLRGQRYRALPPRIEVVNPVGSGDSLLAGLVDAWLFGLEPMAMLRHALACAASNAIVWDPGAVDPDVVRRLEEEIVVEPLGR